MHPRYSQRASAIRRRKKQEESKPMTDAERAAKRKGATIKASSQQEAEIQKVMKRLGTKNRQKAIDAMKKKAEVTGGRAPRTYKQY